MIFVILLISLLSTFYVSIVETNVASADEVSIVAVGDLTVGTQLEPVIEENGPDVFFTEIDEIIKDADITLGFLNCAISDIGEKRKDVKKDFWVGKSGFSKRSEEKGDIGFRAPTELARGLASSGFDVLSLATPHSADYGISALEQTIKLLKWYGVNPIGAASNLKSAREPVILKIRESKIAFLAYYQGGLFSGVYANDLPPKGKSGLAPADYHLMKDDVAKAEKKAELVVVLLHWGKQNSDQVTEQQKFFTHGLIDSGADLVFCQKLHTFQGIELYKSKPIVYSLADFIFERYDKRYSRTVIPEIIFRDNKLDQISLKPIYTSTDVKYQPKLLHSDEAHSVLKKYQNLCAELGTDVEIKDEKGIIELGK